MTIFHPQPAWTRTPMPSILLLSLAALAADPVIAANGQMDATQVVSPAHESDAELFQRARALAASDQREEAIRLYGELLARDPENADARLARGRTHAWMDQWVEAEADLTAVTAASPLYADAWSALGDMYLWSGRATQAVDAYSQWQALQPDRPEPLLARSRARRANGDLDSARADLDAAAVRGADPGAVADGLESLAAPRVNNPEAVAPEGFAWSLQAETGRTWFSGNRDDWDDHALVVRRYLPRASVALELLETRRFGTDDHAWAVDAYVDVWARAYANLRYQHAPDGARYPDHAWRAELFQGVGEGWELSASIDQLRFGSDTTDIYGVGVGRYTGNFYLRGRSRYVASSGSVNHRGQVRYYYAGNGSDYFEVSAGSGRSQEERAGITIDEESSSVGLAFVRFLTPNAGLKLSAGYADDTPRESSLSATVYYRW